MTVTLFPVRIYFVEAWQLRRQYQYDIPRAILEGFPSSTTSHHTRETNTRYVYKYVHFILYRPLYVVNAGCPGGLHCGNLESQIGAKLLVRIPMDGVKRQWCVVTELCTESMVHPGQSVQFEFSR